jgi:hypothetical protein
MSYPACFEICPAAKKLVDLVRNNSNDFSRAAFRAYSEMFCMEKELSQGVCVANWMAVLDKTRKTTTSAWRSYQMTMEMGENVEMIFNLHNEIMTNHSRSIVEKAFKMQCIEQK